MAKLKSIIAGVKCIGGVNSKEKRSREMAHMLIRLSHKDEDLNSTRKQRLEEPWDLLAIWSTQYLLFLKSKMEDN